MKRTVEYYLSKGFDKVAAEYFASGRRKIISVEPNNDYTLTLHFDNGEVRRYDVAPLLEPGTVFAPFRDLARFRQVYLDEFGDVCWDIDPNVDSNVVWNNKVDLCADNCYIDSVPMGGTASA